MKFILTILFAGCIHFAIAQPFVRKDTTYLISVKGDTIRTKHDSTDKTYTKVEIESEFPGGSPAWRRFLEQNLTYPQKAVRKKIEGTVVLQFIVCNDGTVCNVEAISGPDLLREAALAAMKNTPNWKPAYQDGRYVKSYKKQPIVFKLVPQ